MSIRSLTAFRFFVGRGGATVVGDIVQLTRLPLTAMVVFTAWVGLFLAPGAVGLSHGFIALGAIGALVAGACSLNCYLERDLDKKMRRTQDRPLPGGRISPGRVLAVSSGVLVVALCILWFEVNPLCSLLGLLAAVLYLYAYTPLKRKSTFSLLVGAVPGALPPVLGWVAVTGEVGLWPLILFGIIFVWQIPHFLSISLYRQDDYLNAGFKTMPLERGHGSARRQIVIYSVLLALVSLLPFFLGLVRESYLYWGLFLGTSLCFFAFRGVGSHPKGFNERQWARTYFLGTLGYLPLLFIALVSLLT